MHGIKIDTQEYGEIAINYNSDWSGVVRVCWKEKDQVKEVWIPGVVLLAVGIEAMKDKIKTKIISILEEW